MPLEPKDVLDQLKSLGDEALDAVERALFGKVGGAELALQKERAVPTLERLRAEGGLPPRPAVEDAEALAREQLAEIRARRAAAAGGATPAAESAAAESAAGVEGDDSPTPPPEPELKRTL